MNSVQLVGRFTRDPDIRYSNGGSSIARFNLAVDRAYRQENGPTADFISCVAFGKTAEFIEKYFHKGQRIGLNGRIQTGSYEKEDGTKVYTTDVIAERVEFVEKLDDSGGGPGQERSGGSRDTAVTGSEGFMNIPDDIDEELPF